MKTSDGTSSCQLWRRRDDMTSDEIELARLRKNMETYHRLLNDAQVKMGELYLRIAELEDENRELKKGEAA